MLILIFALCMIDARGVATCGASYMFSPSLEGALYNPALMGLNINPPAYFKPFVINVDVYNNVATLAKYGKYADRFLYDKEKQEILNMLPDSGIDFVVFTRPMMGLALGYFGIFMQTYYYYERKIPKELFELLFFGNRLGEVYNTNIAINQMWYFTFALLYGYEIKFSESGNTISFGIGVKYFRGIWSYEELVHRIITQTNADYVSLKDTITVRYAKGGNGFAIDLGFVRHVKDIVFGASLINISPGIYWSNEPRMTYRLFAVDSLSAVRFDEKYWRDTVVDTAVEPFRRRLPFYLILGASYGFTKPFKIGATIEWGSFNSPFSSNIPRLALGIEYRLNWFVPRTGIAIGGKHGFEIGLGFGIATRRGMFNIGVANKAGVIPWAKGISFTMDFQYAASRKEEMPKKRKEPSQPYARKKYYRYKSRAKQEELPQVKLRIMWIKERGAYVYVKGVAYGEDAISKVIVNGQFIPRRVSTTYKSTAKTYYFLAKVPTFGKPYIRVTVIDEHGKRRTWRVRLKRSEDE